MARNHSNWIESFIEYSDHLESPRFMRFWAGVSAVGGALRRKVWYDQKYFVWFPNFYIIFVAPPGVVGKSTTADVAMDLLADVPGIHFGPNSVTWQSLATSFATSCEHFEWNGEYHPMSSITLKARELGSLLDTGNADMVNLLIELWDGSKKYEKQTKMSGNDLVECPWINIVGATTPSWLSNNISESMLGGGLISRCVFLFADEKAKFVESPAEEVPPDHDLQRLSLVQDLEHIAVFMTGPYTRTPEVAEFAKGWYRDMWTGAKEHYSDEQRMGYLARKQTHVYKLAMVLSAAKKDERVIDLDTFQLANAMLSDLENDMQKVFAQIGRSTLSIQAEKLLGVVQRAGLISFEAAYKEIYIYFPDFHEFENVLTGLIRSNQLTMVSGSEGFLLKVYK